jgi:glycosyltransferase involved in cell wall biosynthesis
VYGYDGMESDFPLTATVLPILKLSDWEHPLPDFNSGDWLLENTDDETLNKENGRIRKRIEEKYAIGCRTEWVKRAKDGDVALHFYMFWFHTLLQFVEGTYHIAANNMGCGYELPPYRIFCSEFYLDFCKNKKSTFPGVFPSEECKTKKSAVIVPWTESSDFHFRPTATGGIRTGPILYLARLQRAKGFFKFLEIASAMPESTFWIAGSPAPNVPLPANVVNHGFANSKKRKILLSLASVLVQPTIYHEPFGFNVVEAWLSGTPVVTSNTGAFIENVTRKVGVRVDVGEGVDQWINAIYFAQKLSSEDCRNHALKLSNEESATQQYLDFFRKIRVKI